MKEIDFHENPCTKCGLATYDKERVCIICRLDLRRLSKELGPAPVMSTSESRRKEYKWHFCDICHKRFFGGTAAKYCSDACRSQARNSSWQEWYYRNRRKKLAKDRERRRQRRLMRANKSVTIE